MLGGVQAFALFFFRHAQADGDVHQLVADEGHHARPDQGRQHGLGLDPHLRTDGGIDDGVVDVVDDAGAAHAPGVEHPGKQRAQNAADAVDAEHARP